VVLAGFSQGGAVALYTALRHPARLAGALVLSSYLPLAATLAGEASVANRDLPIFLAHGTADDIVPLTLAEQTRRRLEALGYPVEWHTYPMAHTVCGPEIADIGTWLARVLA
jgi:phospholipase/carboxylesterase